MRVTKDGTDVTGSQSVFTEDTEEGMISFMLDSESDLGEWRVYYDYHINAHDTVTLSQQFMRIEAINPCDTDNYLISSGTTVTETLLYVVKADALTIPLPSTVQDNATVMLGQETPFCGTITPSLSVKKNDVIDADALTFIQIVEDADTSVKSI